jgi:hypothetical protein
MAQSVLDRILNDIQNLQPHELTGVRSAVEHKLSPASIADEEERFLEALLQSGLVSEIKRPIRTSKLDRAAVPISGKPLSETIVEDRR